MLLGVLLKLRHTLLSQRSLDLDLRDLFHLARAIGVEGVEPLGERVLKMQLGGSDRICKLFELGVLSVHSFKLRKYQLSAVLYCGQALLQVLVIPHLSTLCVVVVGLAGHPLLGELPVKPLEVRPKLLE